MGEISRAGFGDPTVPYCPRDFHAQQANLFGGAFNRPGANLVTLPAVSGLVPVHAAAVLVGVTGGDKGGVGAVFGASQL